MVRPPQRDQSGPSIRSNEPPLDTEAGPALRWTHNSELRRLRSPASSMTQPSPWRHPNPPPRPDTIRLMVERLPSSQDPRIVGADRNPGRNRGRAIEQAIEQLGDPGRDDVRETGLHGSSVPKRRARGTVYQLNAHDRLLDVSQVACNHHTNDYLDMEVDRCRGPARHRPSRRGTVATPIQLVVRHPRQAVAAVYRSLTADQLIAFHQAARYSGRRFWYFR